MKFYDLLLLSVFSIAIYTNLHNREYSNVKIDLYILLGFSLLRILNESLSLINSYMKRKLDEQRTNDNNQ